MTDVFISYSRKDKPFAQRLHQALAAEQREAWIDWQDIPLTADWWAEIQEGIEAADAFIFVISPDSVTSQVCHQEIEHAAQHNKRLIPLVCREAEGVPEVLGHLNWIFFRETDDFEAAFKNLLAVMDTDLDWVKRHTRLTGRAMEWERRGRNESYLLRGDDLAEAEQHLSQPNRQPTLTELQQSYIVTSQQRQAADMLRELEQAKALAETEKRRLAEQERYNAQLRKRLLVIIGGLVLVIALGIIVWVEDQNQRKLQRSAEEVVLAIVEIADDGTNYNVCWAGILYNEIKTVLPACERAVVMNPEESLYYESRGIVYTRMGQLPEAQADFEQAIKLARKSGYNQERIPRWQNWLGQLKREHDPFDRRLLEELGDEVKNQRDTTTLEFEGDEVYEYIIEPESDLKK